MPELDKRHFTGGGDVPLDIARQLTLRSGSDRDRDTLTRLGWEGQLIGYVGLIISADGKKVTGARFGMQGKLAASEIDLQAAKLWDRVARDVTISVEVPEAAAFRFAGGTLYSDYLAQEDCKVRYKKGEAIFSEDEAEQHGIGKLCLRLFVYLDKSSNTRGGPGPHLKAMVLVYPLSVDELEELTTLSQAPGWPGVKLVESKAELFPKAQAGTWGAPIFPLILASQRSPASEEIPSGDRLRFAMAALMRTATLPTTCASRKSLVAKCQDVLDGGQEPAGRSPSVCWPAAAEPARERGSLFKFLRSSKTLFSTVNVHCKYRMYLRVFVHAVEFPFASVFGSFCSYI
jgi:hypothetical protein